MTEKHPLLWQNLVFRQCPACSQPLVTIKVQKRIHLSCPDAMCGFQISIEKCLEIFRDKDHILRRFLSKEQLTALDNAVK